MSKIKKKQAKQMEILLNEFTDEFIKLTENKENNKRRFQKRVEPAFREMTRKLMEVKKQIEK